MPNSLKHLQDRIADAQHDIDSIEMHIVKQNESSISPDQAQGLRGFQEMYRKRILKLDAEIATVPNPRQDNSGNLQEPVHSGVRSSENHFFEGLKSGALVAFSSAGWSWRITLSSDL
jgi:hypothetical protein